MPRNRKPKSDPGPAPVLEAADNPAPPSPPTRVDVPGPEETPAPKRGRPPGARTRSAEERTREALIEAKARWKADAALYEAEIADGVMFGSEALAHYMGPEWRLTPKEGTRLVTCASIVVAKRTPAWLAEYAEEIALAGALLGIVGVRILHALEKHAQASREAKASDAKVVSSDPPAGDRAAHSTAKDNGPAPESRPPASPIIVTQALRDHAGR